MAMLTRTERRRLGRVRPELLALVRALLDAAERELGRTLVVTSGTRSAAVQAQLYRDALEQGGGQLAYPVAPPGKSRHQYGAAVDLEIVDGTDDDYRELAALGEGLGLTAGYNFADPDRYHFQLAEPFDTSVARWRTMNTTSIATAAAIVAAVALAVTY